MNAPPRSAELAPEIPPPIWGMGMLLVAFIVDRFCGTGFAFRSTPLAVLVGAGGLLLAVGASAHSPPRAPTSSRPRPPNKKLVTRGPFRYTRNPMYLGLVMMALGFALYFGTIAVLRRAGAAFPLVQLLLHPLRGSEDAAPIRRSVHGLYPPRAPLGVAPRCTERCVRWPVSRVLFLPCAGDGHSSGTCVAAHLTRPTRTAIRKRDHVPSLFGLAPGGACLAASVAGDAVRSYRTISTLPRPLGR